MTEPINGVSLAENYKDIRSRGAGEKIRITLFILENWLYLGLRNGTASYPKTNLFSLGSHGKGLWVSRYLTAKSMKQKLLWRGLRTSVRPAALHTPAQPTFVSGGAALPWTTPTVTDTLGTCWLSGQEKPSPFIPWQSSSSTALTQRKGHLENLAEVYFPEIGDFSHFRQRFIFLFFPSTSELQVTLSASKPVVSVQNFGNFMDRWGRENNVSILLSRIFPVHRKESFL